MKVPGKPKDTHQDLLRNPYPWRNNVWIPPPEKPRKPVKKNNIRKPPPPPVDYLREFQDEKISGNQNRLSSDQQPGDRPAGVPVPLGKKGVSFQGAMRVDG